GLSILRSWLPSAASPRRKSGFSAKGRLAGWLVAGLAACVIGGTWTAAIVLIRNERAYVFDEAGKELLGAQKVLRAHVARTFASAQTIASAVDIWLSETPDAPLRRLDGVIKRLPGFDQRLFSLYLF